MSRVLRPSAAPRLARPRRMAGPGSGYCRASRNTRTELRDEARGNESRISWSRSFLPTVGGLVYKIVVSPGADFTWLPAYPGRLGRVPHVKAPDARPNLNPRGEKKHKPNRKAIQSLN